MSETTVRTLIDEFLAEQAGTTAVERFARAHDDALDASPTAPLAARRYRDLLPATPPAPGQQYAFEVDLDACSGCKACVVACGSLNGLPSGQSFRRTGTLVGANDAEGTGRNLPVLRTVTTACHHCAEPGCLAGCPADAYVKDPDTGVVRHLDDQCIGCQYCTLTCPYEIPAYDAERGIVRKCDLCADRLSAGEAPACVQACPTHAISIRVVDLDDVHARGEDPWPIPSPDPAVTRPATRWRTSEDLRDGVRAVDADAVVPGHAHPPLTVMLVLTQAAVGTLLALLLGTWFVPELAAVVAGPAAATALGTGVVALGASVLHLGRPLQAWRAVLGLRHSWLSREIVAFGAFAGLTATAAAALATPTGPLAEAATWLLPTATVVGLLGVFTSVMVYAVTGRRWWSTPRVAARFAATTALTGCATLLLVVVGTAAVTGADVRGAVRALAIASGSVGVGVGAADLALLRHHRRHDVTAGRIAAIDDELARVAWLHVRRMPGLTASRLVALCLGALAAPWLTWRMLADDVGVGMLTAGAGLMTVVAGELLERWRFFTASAPPRMPGGLR
ncbi:DmsC/YnfH family molybdoenzyme membrane anchor subunit [Egicoccus halophilus]|nr:DmsC/YnfH family molybdoenzyme membrane anchor subunit [Egicoccus halophilus]